MIQKKAKKPKVKQHKHMINNDNQNEPKKAIVPLYSNVPINISRTRFPIIEECCNELQYRIVESNSKALIFWCDAGGSYEFTSSLSQFQFCNHFPGTWSLARKVDLARNIGRLSKILPNLYNFHPKSYIIPSQYSELESFMNENTNQKERKANQKEKISNGKNNLISSNDLKKENADNSHKIDQKITFIIKPDKGSFGRGIILIQDPSEISGYYHTAIAQQYIEPYLIDGLKFDLRVYALVVSIDPLRIYLHREGLARFCTEKYEKPSEGNLELSYAHLTNYALNKNNPNFQQPKDDNGLDNSCHKRSMQAVLKQIEAELKDKKNKLAQDDEKRSEHNKVSEKENEIEKNFNYESELIKGIEDIIRLTVISVQPYINSCYKTVFRIDDEKSRCFEILGFDIMIDELGKPWLLEVNWSPSFADESPFDVMLKKSVIKGALKIVNIPSNFKKCIVARRKAVASRKPVQPLWNMEEELGIAKNTNYKLIYPLSPDDEKYADTEIAFSESKNSYQHLNNGNSTTNIKMENGKSKSYNSFNLNDDKQRRLESQRSPRNLASPRGNAAIPPIFQKPSQVKIVPPIARPNAPIVPRNQHLVSIQSNYSYSQPLFPIQTNNCDDASYSTPNFNSDELTFYQKQLQLSKPRIRSPRRYNMPNDETNDFHNITPIPTQSSITSNSRLPLVNSSDCLKFNPNINNQIKEERSNLEIPKRTISLSGTLPKLMADK